MDCVVKSFPNLTYLSMLKNPACPNYFTGKDSDDYKRYRFVPLSTHHSPITRYYVLFRLPKLKFLDSTPVSAEERKQAGKVGSYAVIAKPDESLVLLQQSYPLTLSTPLPRKQIKMLIWNSFLHFLRRLPLNPKWVPLV